MKLHKLLANMNLTKKAMDFEAKIKVTGTDKDKFTE